MVFDADHVGAIGFFAVAAISIVWIIIQAVIDSRKESKRND